MSDLEKRLDKLPPYLYCDDLYCGQKHYFNLNRDIHGRWSIGFVEYLNHSAIHAANEFNTPTEAVKALEEELNAKV